MFGSARLVRTYCLLGMAAVTAFIALSYWPGRINADSVHEISQSRAGRYTDQYAPILQAVWHLFIFHGLTPAVVLTGQVFILIFAMFLVLRLALGWVGATVFACLIALYPPVLGTVGLVGRDTWFAASTMLAFGLVAAAVRRSGRPRIVCLVLALVATWLSLASRQNAAAATVVVTIVGIALLRYAGRGPADSRGQWWRRAGASTALAVAVTLLCMGSQWVVKQALPVTANHPQAQLEIYDLAALSRADNRNYLPMEVLADRSMRTIRRLTSVDDIVSLILPGGPVKYPFDEREVSALSTAWRKRIEAEPFAYLRERTQLFLRQIGVTAPPQYSSQNDVKANTWGYRTTFPALNRFTNGYVTTFESDEHQEGGVLYRVWLYLVAAVAISVAMVRRRSWPAGVLAALALAPLTYEIGLYFGLMGSGYRYQYPGVAMMSVALVGGISLLVRQRRPAPVESAVAA